MRKEERGKRKEKREERKEGKASFFSHFSFLFFLLFILSLLACFESSSPVDTAVAVSPFASFRDIPGVTVQEIAAIEGLQKAVLQKGNHSLIFGTPAGTESFIETDGKIRGYTARYCDWLSTLFGIPFEPKIFLLSDMISGLNSMELDFGIVRGREELREDYFVTDAIGQRMIIMMRIKGSENISAIRMTRLPRYVFLQMSSTYAMVSDALESGNYEALFAVDYEAAYAMLKSGEADALIEANIIEGALEKYDDAYPEKFLPLLFNPIVMISANPDLEPIISIVNKALQGGAMPYLIRLYEEGYRDYMKHKMSLQLSDKELDYIASHPVVPVAAIYDNYPVCFYNTREEEWQGIFFDLFDEITAITGLSYKIINKSNDEWPVVYEMGKSGEASLIADMVRTQEREDYFIWPETAMEPDYYALISKSDYRDITVNEIIEARVGLARNTAYASTFKYWFPNHTKTLEYENMMEAFYGLRRGEVDLIMSTQGRLMYLTHFLELPDYKTNIVFDQPLQKISAVNKNEELLYSIIDKALKVIDTRGISDRWMRKTYDYRLKVAEARLPWLIGASVLSFMILAMILIMFLRGKSERKRLAKRVAEETSTLMAILDSTPDHIFCKDLDSLYTRYNKSFKDYYNISGSVDGKFDSEALGLSQDLSEYHRFIDKKVFTNRETVVSEVTIPSPSGVKTLFEVIKSPLLLDGRVTGLVGMARDITGRKAAEDEAKKASAEAMKAYAKAETASKAKTHFIANMSHEMRTPMNVIVGLTDLMLEEDDVPDNAKESLRKINIAGNTLMGLINDVLDISKIESGKQDLNPVQYEVASFLNDITTLNTIRIGDKPITFNLEIKENLPFSLFGDDLRLKQILNNLLSNAFKYTKEGSVTLSMDCIGDYTYKNDPVPKNLGVGPNPHSSVWMSYCVSDTGIGIRKDDMAKLFSEYNQVDTRANREIEGTGLGLSISKKFVEMMGGKITVESEYGKGTAFRVSIPQGFVTAQSIGKETAENLRAFRYTDKKTQAQAKLERADLSHARVLVVDDFPTNLDVAAGMLRKYKMQVDCVLSGQEAIQLIAAGKPVYDAVFMDHMMPVMDGLEATKMIRAMDTEYAKKVPIIALTANAVVGNEQMFLENGFTAYLPKPFNVMSLDTVVQKWVANEK